MITRIPPAVGGASDGLALTSGVSPTGLALVGCCAHARAAAFGCGRAPAWAAFTFGCGRAPAHVLAGGFPLAAPGERRKNC